MPTITMKMGMTTAEKKKELIQGLTARASEITSVPEKFFTVYIEEFDELNVGIGGITLEEFKKQK